MTEVILHIGTPKTGTTAIQDALTANIALLQEADISFIKAGRHRAAHNDLANAIRRNGGDHKFKDALNTEINAEISARPNGRLLLSSEVFSLINPKQIKASLPFLSELPLKIVVYLRRQDSYVEAFFKQRIKNGRSVMPFEQFLESRMAQRITDYKGLLEGWSTVFPKAEMIPKLYEREQFVDGDVIADFMSLLKISLPKADTNETQRNISPSKDVIDIMLALSPHLDGRQLRTLYHTLKPLKLEGFSASGDLFTSETRQAYLAQFVKSNEKLRIRYFPESAQLFSNDISRTTDTGASGLSKAQKGLLAAALKEAFELRKTEQTT